MLILGLKLFCLFTFEINHERKNTRTTTNKSKPKRKIFALKRNLITDFLLETIQFNKENASKLESVKKLNENLDLFLDK